MRSPAERVGETVRGGRGTPIEFVWRGEMNERENSLNPISCSQPPMWNRAEEEATTRISTGTHTELVGLQFYHKQSSSKSHHTDKSGIV